MATTILSRLREIISSYVRGQPEIENSRLAAGILPTWVINDVNQPIPVGLIKPDASQTIFNTAPDNIASILVNTDTTIRSVTAGKTYYLSFIGIFNDNAVIWEIKDSSTRNGYIWNGAGNLAFISFPIPIKFTTSVIVKNLAAAANFFTITLS